MKNQLASARFVHRALIIGCSALIAFAFASTNAQHYESALHLLRALNEIDLDKWAKLVENRQSVSLNGPLMVGPVLKQEAELAGLPIKRGRIVWERVAIRVRPSSSEVRNTTLEALLTSVFRDVEAPQLFYPDEQSLRRRLRALFSGQRVDGVEPYRFGPRFELSRAELTLDASRDTSRDRVFLRLEWYKQDTDTIGATEAAVTRDIPLDGTREYEVYDFEHFIRDMHPNLVNPSRTRGVAEGSRSWPVGVLEQLAPVWGEIKDRTPAAAYAHVQTRLNETKGNVNLFRLTIYRRQILVVGSTVLLFALCVLLLHIMRLNDLRRIGAAPLPDFQWLPLFSSQVARVVTFFSLVVLPVVTFGFILARFGKAQLSAETVAAALAAGAGALCAVQIHRSVLELRRLNAIGVGLPVPSRVDERRAKLLKTRMASRAAGRPSRILGRVLLVIGFVAGPIGALTFSVYLMGLGIGSQANGTLPFLAILVSPLCVLVGWVLAAGRKDLVLFLRRFGNEALNDSVRDLIQANLRKRARLVTLDDSAFAPLGPRWLGLASSLAPSGVVLGAIAVGYAGFAKVAESELREETPFGEALTLIQVGIVLLGVLAGLTAAILFAAALRAHFLGRRMVHDDSSRERVLHRLRALRSLARAPVIAAPMATVVTVTASEWQATVASIARMCDVTLIDISHPSESIHWELETLKEARVRIVLLAQREALARWWDVTGDDADARLAAEMRQLAAGVPLVTYDAPDRLNETELVEIV